MLVPPRKVRLVDIDGHQPTRLHRLLQADGTPGTKARRSLVTMLGLSCEDAAAAVELFDSKDATCGVHAADSLGDPSKVWRAAGCVRAVFAVLARGAAAVCRPRCC
jgi:hypothetical protein